MNLWNRKPKRSPALWKQIENAKTNPAAVESESGVASADYSPKSPQTLSSAFSSAGVRRALRRRKIKNVSSSRARINWLYVKFKTAFLSSFKKCRKCGKASCDLHHSRGRCGTLYIDARFFVALCRTCHNWIPDNMDAARKLGLLCAKGDWGKAPDDDETRRLRDLMRSA